MLILFYSREKFLRAAVLFETFAVISKSKQKLKKIKNKKIDRDCYGREKIVCRFGSKLKHPATKDLPAWLILLEKWLKVKLFKI